ncbi:MAG: tRNA (N(6)-L-threonylcarbamoyladenosine(37)-C(2))-methylthiotransferase MtaB [Alphaproteobacteria bacterium]
MSENLLPIKKAAQNTDEKKSSEVINFGCRLNLYESEAMKDLTREQGDLVVINSCAVTAEAERQARQTIRKIHRERPEARIVVTGCAAQINPETFSSMPEVAQVMGNDLKLKASSWQNRERILVNDIQSVKETASHLVEGFDQHSRAFVQVQNGCDHRCTFCIIPYGRGASRSVPAGEVVAQVQKLVEKGYKEIVLTGVDMTAYGRDLPGTPSLGQLAEKILTLVPALPRLRLSSVDPVEIDDTIMKLLAEEPRLMPYLHLSVQAGDDMILKRMKRRHLRANVLEICQKLRQLRPDIAFGADIIAGFPTETDAMFANSVALVMEAGLSFLHVFPYSARTGTPAAKMPQVRGEVRRERAAILRALGEKQEAVLAASMVGQEVELLVEQSHGSKILGRAPNFMLVELAPTSQAILAGSLIKARITQQEGADNLLGHVQAHPSLQ